LRVMQEAEPVLAPAPVPSFAPAFSQAPTGPSRASPTSQQVFAALNVDNLPSIDKQILEVMANELGLGGAADKVRHLLDTLLGMAANNMASQCLQPQGQEAEEACQYTGTAEQVAAWQQELAKTPAQASPAKVQIQQQQQQQQQQQPGAGEQQQEPAKPAMEAETDRTASVKRPAPASGAAALPAIEENTDYRFDADEEAASHLFGGFDDEDGGQAASEPQAKASKTVASTKTAQESALEVVEELQKQLSSAAPEVVISDVETTAAASSTSVG
jgi:hypothetical protein